MGSFRSDTSPLAADELFRKAYTPVIASTRQSASGAMVLQKGLFQLLFKFRTPDKISYSYFMQLLEMISQLFLFDYLCLRQKNWLRRQNG
jgi:hypothetical protein